MSGLQVVHPAELLQEGDTHCHKVCFQLGGRRGAAGGCSPAGEIGMPSALFEGAAVACVGGQAPLETRAKVHKDTPQGPLTFDRPHVRDT